MKLTAHIAAFVALCASAFGQTYLTVTADTNRVIRTNFTLGNAQVTGLQALLDAKQTATAALTNLSTNNGGALTNLAASNIVGTVALASNVSGIVAIANGGTGSQTASNARTALGLGSAATNPASAFQPASANLTNLANNNGGSLTNLSATNFLPAYAGQDGKVLAVATGGTNIEWKAISNTVTDGSTITNIPAANITGTLSIGNGGTGASNAESARINLLPAYSNNATKVLAVNSGADDVEWITITNGGGGSTSGVTSVDVSGGSTGLTASGGPITNSGTITLGGTLSIAAGGTGQTNAALAIEALLPAYTNNAGKVLGLDTNLALVWTTNASGGGGGGSGTVTSVDASGGSTGMNFTGGPITTNGTLTLGGTLAVGSGGTGANDVTNARINLLPAYTNNAGKALVVNTNGSDIVWQTLPFSVANGGTGANNTDDALVNLGIIQGNSTVRLLSTNAASQSVTIGKGAESTGQNSVSIGYGSFVDDLYGVAIGNGAYATLGASLGGQSSVTGYGGSVGYGADATDGGAVGHQTYTERGAAIGKWAYSIDGVAAGYDSTASATNSVQLLQGTNSTENTIQFMSAGSVTTNAWSALANSTTFGHYAMQAPTNGTANQVLALNSNATAMVWVANGGGGTIDLSTTNATGILPLAKGGTGSSNVTTALTNLGIFTANSGLFISSITNSAGLNFAVVIGVTATNGANGTGNTVVGYGASGRDNGTGNGGVAIGRIANTTNSGIAIGYSSSANGGIALGESAIATNGVQIGAGANNTANTIQFRSAGLVDTNEWSALANSSTNGQYAMTNTAGISATNTIVGYDGTNFVTNVITVTRGIITGWAQ